MAIQLTKPAAERVRDELEKMLTHPTRRRAFDLLAESGLLALEVEVRGPASWALMLGPGLRNPSQEEFEDRFSRRSVVYQQGEEVERLDASGIRNGFVLLSSRHTTTALIVNQREERLLDDIRALAAGF